MEQEQKLNSLAIQYRDHRDEAAFNELYNTFRPEWDRRKYADAKRTLSDVTTIETMYGEVLWKCAKSYNGSANFSHMMNRSIKRACIDLLERNKYRQRHESVSLNANDDSDAPTFEIAEEFDTAYSSPTEETVFREMFDKKEKDKVSLVSYLIESSKTTSDEATTTIIEMFAQYKNLSTLAKALGMHHETVKRKLTRLSRHYDANRFGDIREYLAV